MLVLLVFHVGSEAASFIGKSHHVAAEDRKMC